MRWLTLLFLLSISIGCFGQVDTYSRSSCFVIQLRNAQPLRVATGFFFSNQKRTYFITNNHVVGGKFFVDEYISTHKNVAPPLDSLPNKISIRIYDVQVGTTCNALVPIEDNSYLKFYADPEKTKLIDLVAIPISDAIKIQLNGPYILSNK